MHVGFTLACIAHVNLIKVGPRHVFSRPLVFDQVTRPYL